MNNDFWTLGVIESDNHRIAWPGMTRHDAETLSPAPTKTPADNREFRTNAIIDGKPFIVRIFPPMKGEAGPTRLLLVLNPEYSRQVFHEEYPIRQEINLYENLFSTFLGSPSHEHRKSWGTVAIVEDPRTNDPSISVRYNV
jgi:hypothetical protein